MEKNKKILFYCSSLSKGGAERVFVNLAEYFTEKGYQVYIVTQYQLEDEYVTSSAITRVISDLTDAELRHGRIKNFFARIVKLRNIMKQISPDIVFSCNGKNNFMAIFTNSFLKNKVVVSVVAEPEMEYYTPSMRLLAKTYFALADGIVFQTEKAKEFFPKYIKKKSVILPNSLNPAFIKPRFEGDRKKEIVAVGRLDDNKNHAMLIKAFANISENFPEYRLCIYGEGENRVKLQVLINELGLTQKISMPGRTSHIEDRIYESSLFVLTSNSEGMPNSLIEAMSLGLCVISTDCPSGGPGELIQNGVNGCLIPVKDEKALENCMKECLGNDEHRETMGRNATQIQLQMSPSQVNKKWELYFNHIMSQ